MDKIEKIEFVKEDNGHDPTTNILWQIKDKLNELIDALNELKESNK